jgi:transcriptional regulator of nitric oxide reductase
MDSAAKRRVKTWCVHLLRVGLLAVILIVIHLQHARIMAVQRARSLGELPLDRVKVFFPTADRLGDAESHGGRSVLDRSTKLLGYVIQTAPDSDGFLGFSGPTNCLVAFNPRDEILGVAISLAATRATTSS